jgi:hypothetical protein
VNYISDALGFRVAGTHIPTHDVNLAAPHVVTPTVAYSYLPYATSYDYYLPPGVSSIPSEVPVQAEPVAVANSANAAQPVASVESAPVTAVNAGIVSSQYHAQDELGQYNYGYSNPLTAKQETKSGGRS